MIFTRGSDGITTVDEWDQEIQVAPELIHDADPTFLRVEGRRLYLSVANGNAEYEIEGFDEYGIAKCRLKDWHLFEGEKEPS